MYTEVTYVDTGGFPRHRRFPDKLELEAWLETNIDPATQYWKTADQGGEITRLKDARTVMEVSDLPRTVLTLYKGPGSREPFRRFLITEVRTALPDDGPVSADIAWILRGKPLTGDAESLFANDDAPEEDFAQATAQAVGNLLNTTVYHSFAEWTFGWVHPLFETGFDQDFVAARSQWQTARLDALKARAQREKAIRRALSGRRCLWTMHYGQDADGRQYHCVEISTNGKTWKSYRIHDDGFEANLKTFLMQINRHHPVPAFINTTRKTRHAPISPA